METTDKGLFFSILYIHLALSSFADLTRQYKTMQSEMALRIHMLEQTVNKLREQLGELM